MWDIVCCGGCVLAYEGLPRRRREDQTGSRDKRDGGGLNEGGTEEGVEDNPIREVM